MRDGIYFGLPDIEYHALPRLSATGIKKLLISPPDFWLESWMNPDRDTTEKAWQRDGRAYHAALLEPVRFMETYTRAISKDDFAGAILTTDTEIKAKLAEFGQAKTKAGENVLDRAHRLKAAGYGGPIWHIEEERWREDNEGLEPLPGPVFDQITRGVERVHRVPEVAKHFEGGAPEVSVLWTCPDTGIPMKCRFDYLKPKSFTDLKSFANASGKSVLQAIVDAFQYDRQHISAMLYWDCAELVRAGEIEWMKKGTMLERGIAENPDPMEAWFVFMQKNDVPNIYAADIEILDTHGSYEPNSIGASAAEKARAKAALTDLQLWARKARMEIAWAKQLFLTCREIYGTDEWLPLRPITSIGDKSFREYWLDTLEGAEQ